MRIYHLVIKLLPPGPRQPSDVMMMFPPGLPSLTLAALRILMVMAPRQVAGA